MVHTVLLSSGLQLALLSLLLNPTLPKVSRRWCHSDDIHIGEPNEELRSMPFVPCSGGAEFPRLSPFMFLVPRTMFHTLWG